MRTDFQEAQRVIGADRRLRDFDLRREGTEFHLEKAGDTFVRLVPAGEERWQLEVFRAAAGWEKTDMTGTLEECLGYLARHRPYQH
jgi:hypothetical protein